MKSVKFVLNLVLITSLLFLLSCTDKCKEVICQNEGVCDNGNCACEFLYEGMSCELEIRENYLGTYAGTLTLDNGTSTSSINTTLPIQKDGQPADKLISGLGNFTITEKDKFDIPFQETDLITSGNVSTLEGSGSFSGNQVVINFTVKSGDVTIRSSFNGSK